jgi:hypothetical protein
MQPQQYDQMAAKCGRRLMMKQVSPDQWNLNEPCPDGATPGTTHAELLQRCEACVIKTGRISVVRRGKDGVERPIVEAAKLEPSYPPAAESPATGMTLPLSIADIEAFEPPPPVVCVWAPFKIEDIINTSPPPPECVLDEETLVAPSLVVEPKQLVQAPPVEAVVTIEPPALDQIRLPGGISLGSIINPEAEIDVDAVIAAAMKDLPGGPSEGGLSSHVMGDAKCWKKFYYSHIVGLKPRRPNRYFQIGSLLHYCMAARYTLGFERQYDPCTHVAQAGGSEIAALVRALVEGYTAKYAVEEWNTWSVRAVEYNMLAWFPCRVGGKTVQIPISCRIDLIHGLKRPEDAHPAGGPMPTGVYLRDHKTCNGITKDLVEGYGMDWQLNVQASVFRQAHYEEVLGPLNGVTIGLFSTAKKRPTPDCFMSLRAPLSDRMTKVFVEQQLKPTAAQIFERISCEEMRKNPDCWERDFRQCADRFGRCLYAKICDGGEEIVSAIDFVVDEHMITHPDKFAKPKGGVTTAAAPSKKEKKEPVKPSAQAEYLLSQYATALAEQIETTPSMAPLARTNFLGQPGNTKEKTVKALTDEFKKLYKPYIDAKLAFPFMGYDMTYTKTGIAWAGTYTESPEVPATEGKGRFTWKQVSEWICEHIWYDLSKAMPAGA